MKINFPLLDEPLTIENATFLVLEDQFTFSTIVKHWLGAAPKAAL